MVWRMLLLFGVAVAFALLAGISLISLDDDSEYCQEVHVARQMNRTVVCEQTRKPFKRIQCVAECQDPGIQTVERAMHCKAGQIGEHEQGCSNWQMIKWCIGVVWNHLWASNPVAVLMQWAGLPGCDQPVSVHEFRQLSDHLVDI